VAELLNERPGITAAELSALTGYDEQTLRPWLESPPKLPAR
jgi:hypothetical protein